MTDAVEAARVMVLHASRSFGGPNRGPSGRDSEKRTLAALDALEAAIRADERKKVHGAVHASAHDGLAMCGGDGLVVALCRECRLQISEPPVDWHSPADCPASEGALRAALRRLWASAVPMEGTDGEWDAAIAQASAALDGAPYEPSEAEVERASFAIARELYGPHASWESFQAWSPEHAEQVQTEARAALKAAWGDGT